MLLIALLIACLLYKRRNTGKMELGDEEERKSFRSKGIPVIFQDELEEKPEIVTKSPIILKDEKPPLLPQYNGMSQDGECVEDRGEFDEVTARLFQATKTTWINTSRHNP
jgi:neurexin